MAISTASGIPVNLNLNVRGLKPSATLAINELSAELKRQGRTVYRLGLGQSPFPIPEPVVEELRRNAHQKEYLAVKGLLSLREAVADYHRRTHSTRSTAEDILVGPGSKELMFLVQLVYYGDLVIPTPSWVSYAPQAQILGRKVEWLPTLRTQGWRLLPEDFDAFCREDSGRPRLVILNYPNNPTGLTYNRSELKELARIAQEHRIIVISDEIYGELHHQGAHSSIAEFYPEGTIISGGLSKWCGAGGWRLGTFIFPPELRWLLEPLAAVASETYTSTSAPIQYAAVQAFLPSDYMDHYLRQCRRVLAALGGWSAERLREAGVQVDTPEGGFYLMPDFSPLGEALRARGVRTSRHLCQKLLEDTGVATLPGEAFGRPADELTARFAYVDFDGGACLRGLETLPADAEITLSFLRQHCAPVAEAIERVAEWLS